MFFAERMVKQMNYSHAEIKRKQKELTAASRKMKYRAEEWLAYCGIILITTALLMLVFGTVGAVRGLIDSAPVMEQIDMLAPGEPSKMFDSAGNEIQILSYEDITQEYVSIDIIPQYVQKAFVAAEDKRFYEHHGVDMLGMIRTVYSGAVEENDGLEETSTITRQLIQNQMLSGTSGDTFLEKFSKAVKEQHLAIELENHLDKSKILEYYLNTIHLGENVTGVQAAARRYFDKDIFEVTVSEAAVLAAIVSNPTEYNPIQEQEENKKRRRIILKSMLEEEYISEEEFAAALDDDVYSRVDEINAYTSKGEEKTNSYYADAVVEQVIRDLKEELGFSETEAYNYLYRGGLRIYTCQEPKLQKICDEVINSKAYYPKTEKSEEQPQASFVLIEQATGKVKAIVGGRELKGTDRSVNRATELKCQPGSALALLSTYTPALDTAGFTLGDVVDDTKYVFQDIGEQLPQAGDTYEGLLTLRTAIARAKSIPAVKTLQEVSAQTGYDFLRKFSFTTLIKQEIEESNAYSDLRLRLALGELNQGVTNLELTSAYAAIASGGVYQTPRFYTKIVDSDGNVLIENEEEASRVIKKDTAWLLTDVMQDVISQENAEFLRIETSEAGYRGKTVQGTDLWFEGFTPYYTAGIWSGMDDSVAQEDADYHIVIWREIMERVHEETKKTEGTFEKPSDIISREICTKCGKLALAELCDEAEGGSTVQKEYFVRGTEPNENCSCHVKYAFCGESNQLAVEACPEDTRFYRVLLQKQENVVTADTPNTVAQNIGKAACDIHRTE